MLAMACDVVECWAKGAGFQMCWDSLVYAFDVGRVQRIEEFSACRMGSDSLSLEEFTGGQGGRSGADGYQLFKGFRRGP